MTRALPAPRLWNPGDLATAAMFNAMNYATNFGCLAPPQVVAFQSVAQSLTSGTTGIITLDSELVDTDNFHSTTTNTQNLVAPFPGWYDVAAGGVIASNTAGYRVGQINQNGSRNNYSLVTLAPVNGTDTWFATRPIRVYCNLNDVITLGLTQSSGSTLATIAGGCWASMTWRSN